MRIWLFYLWPENSMVIVKVCPHAGGVGLCEMVQHLQIFDYISITGSKDGRFIEHVAEEHEHFEDPCVLNEKACYVAPTVSLNFFN